MDYSNKELLELAAKAAGYKVRYVEAATSFNYQGFLIESKGKYSGLFPVEKHWNPLTDDGDALRLAVKLRMRIGIDSIPVGFVVVMSDDPLRKDTHEQIDNDPYAATRLAIVCAAAEIGKLL